MSDSIGRRAAVSLLAAVTIASTSATTASAADPHPCHTPRTQTFKWGGETFHEVTSRCPLVSGNVPVYQWSATSAPVVGYVTSGHRFLLQKWSNFAAYQAGRNHWWASTRTNAGRWGWVAEVYFRGGAPNERDGGLKKIPPITCGGRCKPIPPWMR